MKAVCLLLRRGQRVGDLGRLKKLRCFLPWLPRVGSEGAVPTRARCGGCPQAAAGGAGRAAGAAWGSPPPRGGSGSFRTALVSSLHEDFCLAAKVGGNTWVSESNVWMITEVGRGTAAYPPQRVLTA